MVVELEITLPNLTAKQKATVLGAVYRQSLVEVGHSADFHVYDLEQDLIERKRNLAAGKFLMIAKKYYESLEGIKKKIFLCEILERGRHYPYWYLPYADSKSFSRLSSSVYKAASKVF